MPDDTTILSLPLILPAQAQKHVTHNEALTVLDLIVQLAVINRTLATAPALPAVGDRHIVAAGATGPWAGQSGRIALFSETGWQFTAPLLGWQAHVLAEGATAVFDGVAWKTPAESPLIATRLGISATPDATNRLAVSSPASLLNHAGAGHQLKLYKAAAGDTASLLFQTGFSGRAEMGTAGGDDFSVKVSANGSAYFTALVADAASGEVTLPQPIKLGGQAADPVAPADGTLWLNTTTGEVKVRTAGASVTVGSGGGGVADGDKGDVSVTGGGTVWTIDPGAVGLSKMADLATGTLLGRATAGSGVPEALTEAQVRTVLNVANGATANAADSALRDRATHTGSQPAATISDFAATVAANALTGFTAAGSRTAVVAADSIVAAFGKVQKWLNDLSALAFSGNAADLAGTKTAAFISDFSTAVAATAAVTANTAKVSNAAHTGDVTGATALTIATDAVDNTKLANMATATFKGRTTAGAGDPEDLSAAQATALLATFTSGAKGLVPASGGGTTTFLRADGSFAAPAGGGATDLTYTAATRLLESNTGADVTLPLATIADPGLADTILPGANRFLAMHECVAATNTESWTFVVSGTGAAHGGQTPLDGGYGWQRGATGTTATGRTSIVSPAFNIMRLGLGRAIQTSRIRIVTLSTVTETYTVRSGFIDSNTGESVDGAFFRYTNAVNGGRFEAVTRANSVETVVDTATAVAVGTTYVLEVDVNAAGTSAAFRINGALVATITTTIPTAGGRELGYGLMALKSVGITSVSTYDVDYVIVEQRYSGR